MGRCQSNADIAADDFDGERGQFDTGIHHSCACLPSSDYALRPADIYVLIRAGI